MQTAFKYQGREGLPITWNHVIEKEALKIKELEHVPSETASHLFLDML
jgi:hypothetical protein